MITLAIKAILLTILLLALSSILWAIEADLCEFLDFLEELFEKFAGLKPVLFSEDIKKTVFDPETGGAKIITDGVNVAKETSLVEVIFGNSTVSRIYWDMAIVGMVMVFGFAIFAVIRKMFDTGDKLKHSMSAVMGNSLKAILLICSLNMVVTLAMNGSQILLNTMDDIFVNAGSRNTVKVITFDENDYAAMLHAVNTLGNYSVNKSYNSRYNLNDCYNEIREDLDFLSGRGKFQWPYRFDVTTYDENTGEEIVTKTGEDSWQSLLYDIQSTNNGSDAYIDEFNEERNDAILYAMDVIRSKEDLKPLDHYTITLVADGATADYKIGRMVMLIGTIGSAWNSEYNRTMSFTDNLRSQYLYGTRNIYKKVEMNKDFDFSIFSWHHILVLVFAVIFIKQYLGICFSAVARLFNMLFLYLVAPPFLAVMPLDDGAKAKQWTTAFIIQTFSLFGVVLSMRLYKILIPVVINTNLFFFTDTPRHQMYAQVLFLLACAMVVKKAGGMITGILADNAGMQAVNATDMMSEGSNTVDRTLSTGRFIAGKAAGAVIGLGRDALGRADKARDDKKKGQSGGGGGGGSGGGEGAQGAQGGEAASGGGGAAALGPAAIAVKAIQETGKAIKNGAKEVARTAKTFGKQFASDVKNDLETKHIPNSMQTNKQQPQQTGSIQNDNALKAEASRQESNIAAQDSGSKNDQSLPQNNNAPAEKGGGITGTEQNQKSDVGKTSAGLPERSNPPMENTQQKNQQGKDTVVNNNAVKQENNGPGQANQKEALPNNNNTLQTESKKEGNAQESSGQKASSAVPGDNVTIQQLQANQQGTGLPEKTDAVTADKKDSAASQQQNTNVENNSSPKQESVNQNVQAQNTALPNNNTDRQNGEANAVPEKSSTDAKQNPEQNSLKQVPLSAPNMNQNTQNAHNNNNSAIPQKQNVGAEKADKNTKAAEPKNEAPQAQTKDEPKTTTEALPTTQADVKG